MDIFLAIPVFIISLVLLIKSSDYFVASVAKVSRLLGMSELVIGLTVVAIGTSLPELGASTMAAYLGNTGISIGNIVGSNLANIGLIIGIAAVIAPLAVSERIYRQDAVILIITTVIFYLFLIDGVLSGIEGIMLLFLFAVYLLYVFKLKPVSRSQEKAIFHERFKIHKLNKATLKELLILVVSLGAIIFSAYYLVESTSSLALGIGIGEGVVAMVLIALGTSVPELMIAIAAIRKKMQGLLIGNVVGSNISNMLLIGGVASVVRPIEISNNLLILGVPAMIFMTSIFLIFMRNRAHVSRTEGFALIAAYVAMMIVVTTSVIL